jgi:hypothetical protein
MSRTKKTKKTSRQNAYIGKAGQLAVMSELALLGYNVALPEIDKGDDIFVVDDDTGKLWRLQVKGAKEQSRAGDYQVIIDEDQIQREPKGDGPDRTFVFALRREEAKLNFLRFVIMSRKILKDYIERRAAEQAHNGKIGSVKMDKGKLRRTLSITMSKRKKTLGQFFCSYVCCEAHMEAWGEWPYIDHEAIAASETAAKKGVNAELSPHSNSASLAESVV